ncbi:MAG: alpha-galactosidase [Chromatiales bacterium]|nr:alpha-galactosidase [Chromatiales bacterium]
MIVLAGAAAEELLELYADHAAAKRASRSGGQPVGWSSWYQYFTGLTGDDLEKNLLAGAPRLSLRGLPDRRRLRVRHRRLAHRQARFPDPAGLARSIREAGFTAGIWTAPFSASESSELFGRHPGWFVSEGGKPKPCYKNWKKTIYALDTTHPEALAWLSETIGALRGMGFTYFKHDFLFAAAMQGGRRENVTPIQAYRRGLAALRDAAAGGFVPACGAPLLPSLGLCHGMRVGEDTAPFWNPRMGGCRAPTRTSPSKTPSCDGSCTGAGG